MATEVKLPELGEGVDKGEVTRILVSTGDSVEADQPVLEIETGKATLEVPCPEAGTVEDIKVNEGAEVEVGQVILTLSGGDAASGKDEQAEETNSVPDDEDTGEKQNEEETSGKEEQEEDKEGKQPRQEAEADNAAEEKQARESKRETIPSAEPDRPAGPTPPAAPSVRKFAREIGIDISKVKGSGPHGRVSIDDVKSYSKDVNERRETAATPGVKAVPALPDFERWGDIERERMSTIRRRTAEHMALCWSQIPHVTQMGVADITELDQLRKKFAPRAEKEGGKLTITAMLAKIVGSALKVFPDFNASVDIEAEEIVRKQYYNIGIAVDTPKGLLVPVLSGIDKKNMIDIAVDLVDVAQRTREGKIKPNELEGGTFTITNLGSIGGTHFTPIVNWPEVAILGVGRAYHEPGVNKDTGICSPTFKLPLSLSYDHRVIDGASGARFLQWIVEAIEEPLLLSLEG
jgi:pyruvate dehydrogenase E2 component (dihydrolipoamide acetyltransferase)